MRTALTLAAAALAIGGVLAAPAGLASADPSAQNTINYWQQQGYQVNIDRVGSAPMEDCVVTGVRNPNTQTRLQRVNSRGPGPSYLVPIVVSKTVQVSLYCVK
ncbi:MAG TPA: hypothetical protein VFB19_19955 [Mycobacterium sp.]|nr:hypothetical protein [Mycobacterium sp.]